MTFDNKWATLEGFKLGYLSSMQIVNNAGIGEAPIVFNSCGSNPKWMRTRWSLRTRRAKREHGRLDYEQKTKDSLVLGSYTRDDVRYNMTLYLRGEKISIHSYGGLGWS